MCLKETFVQIFVRWCSRQRITDACCRLGRSLRLCSGRLGGFVDWLPTDVKILTDYVLLSEDRVLLSFYYSITVLCGFSEMDQLWVHAASLHVGPIDHTFKTNKEGLLLGCCGPAGLRILPGKPPSMRVMLRFFLLSRFSAYTSYVDETSKSGAYGDDMLMAAAALFLRPVWIVRPDSKSPGGMRKCNPPSNVSVEACGHRIVLALVPL